MTRYAPVSLILIASCLGAGCRKRTTSALNVSIDPIQAPALSGACPLLVDITLGGVNLAQATISYRILDGGGNELRGHQPFAGKVLLEARRQQVVEFLAALGGSTATGAFTIDTTAVDNVLLAIESIAMTGSSATVRWTKPAHAIDDFIVYYGTTRPSAFEDLKTQQSIQVSPGDSRLREVANAYELEIPGLDPSPAVWYYFAVWSSDGCESPIAANHTRPSAASSAYAQLATAPAHVLPAKHQLPPLLVDRYGPVTGLAPLDDKGRDGLADIVVVRDDGRLDVFSNLGNGAFSRAVRAQFAAAPNPLRALSHDIDRDRRPDVVVLTESTIYIGAGNDLGVPPANTLNFTNVTALGVPETAPKGARFYDVALGDFDGDGLTDIAASLASETAGGFQIWYGGLEANKLHVDFRSWAAAPKLLSVPATDKRDLTFVAADVDRDGLCDIVHARHEGGRLYYETILTRPGRGNTGSYHTSEAPATSAHTVRWDRTAFADINSDGWLDLVTDAKDTGQGAGQNDRVVVGYVQDRGTNSYGFESGAGTFATGTPRINLRLGPVDNEGGHLAVVEVGGDDLLDIVYHRSWNGSAVTSDFRTFRGDHDTTLGTQNWDGFVPGAWTPLLVDAGETPHAAFAVADLTHDGHADYCVVHESSAGASLRVLAGRPVHAYETDSGSFVRLGKVPARLRAPDLAHVARFASNVRAGDLWIGAVDTKLGFLAAAGDLGLRSGGFSEERALDLPATEPVAHAFPSRSNADVYADVLFRLQNGILGHAQFDPVAATYKRIDARDVAYEYVDAGTRVLPGTFDHDERGDALVIDPRGWLWVLSTAPNAGLSLTRDGNTPISAIAATPMPDVVAVADRDGDGIDEVLTVLPPQGGMRKVQVWQPWFDGGDWKPRLRLDQDHSHEVDFEITSLAVASFTGTVGASAGIDKTILAGTTDGRVIELPSKPLFSGGSGPMLVWTGDVSNDGIPDLVFAARGSTRAHVWITNRAVVSGQPWKVQGDGTFSPREITLSAPVTTLGGGPINNDPLADLIFVSEGGQDRAGSLELFVGHVTQVAR